MFLNLLGIIGLLVSFFYIIFHIFTAPVYSSQDNIPTNNKITISSPKPSTETGGPVIYSGYCLNVPILMYHHVQPAELAKEKWQTNLSVNRNVFSSQMAYLAQSGYTTITLEILAEALINKKPLPNKSIILTFDDGYEDFYTYAYPVIKQHNLKANLMLSTGLVNNPDYLNWGQVKEMASSTNIKIYNHTWSHRNLAGASTEKIALEISRAQQQLQDQIGVKSTIFAYPYGGYSDKVINYLKSNGFVIALSTDQGTTQCNSFLMTLNRTRIGNSQLSYYGI